MLDVHTGGKAITAYDPAGTAGRVVTINMAFYDGLTSGPDDAIPSVATTLLSNSI